MLEAVVIGVLTQAVWLGLQALLNRLLDPEGAVTAA